MKNKLISILIPFYNEEGSLFPIIDEIKSIESAHKNEYDFEILLLDNHSIDKSHQESLKLKEMYNNVKVIRHSRNFGYQANILSGYASCSGDAAIQIDADGEDDPLMISDFLKKWENGL